MGVRHAGATRAAFGSAVAAVSAGILPLLVSVPIVPASGLAGAGEVGHARAAGAADARGPGGVPPFPALIVPLLVSVVIVPALDPPAARAAAAHGRAASCRRFRR